MQSSFPPFVLNNSDFEGLRSCHSAKIVSLFWSTTHIKFSWHPAMTVWSLEFGSFVRIIPRQSIPQAFWLIYLLTNVLKKQEEASVWQMRSMIWPIHEHKCYAHIRLLCTTQSRAHTVSQRYRDLIKRSLARFWIYPPDLFKSLFCLVARIATRALVIFKFQLSSQLLGDFILLV